MTDRTPVTPSQLEAVHAYVSTARWFGGKGRDCRVVDVRRVAVLEGPEPAPRVGIELVTLSYAGGPDDPDTAVVETYQLPLAYYREEQERIGHALVGTWDDPELGPVRAYDALHDREATVLWLQAFAQAEGGTEGESSPHAVGDLTFHRLPGHELDLDVHSTLFSGEQSNSSLLFGDDALMKVFRKVTPGDNPDIVIHRALTEQGSDHVAALYGWLELAVPDSDEPVQLAMLQQFLRTASDGWGLALASVRDLFAEADLRADEVGGDFAGEAERLGLATAQVHDVLAASFPTRSWGPEDLDRLSEAMLARLDDALTVVPGLAEHADRLRATFSGVAELGRVVGNATAQRVHGDFHLGQTLRTVKGWKIVDFEGEPAKPLHERVEPDLVWRDVAGMLRSFDYAAHAVIDDFNADEQANRQIAFRAKEWLERNQTAYLRGYTDNSGKTDGNGLSTHQQTILQDYIADKAVYEAVYETRNRPTWLPIPLGAIARLTQADLDTTVSNPEAPA